MLERIEHMEQLLEDLKSELDLLKFEYECKPEKPEKEIKEFPKATPIKITHLETKLVMYLCSINETAKKLKVAPATVWDALNENRPFKNKKYFPEYAEPEEVIENANNTLATIDFLKKIDKF